MLARCRKCRRSSCSRHFVRRSRHKPTCAVIYNPSDLRRNYLLELMSLPLLCLPCGDRYEASGLTVAEGHLFIVCDSSWSIYQVDDELIDGKGQTLPNTMLQHETQHTIGGGVVGDHSGGQSGPCLCRSLTYGVACLRWARSSKGRSHQM